MPKLKQLSCSVELGPGKLALKEYGTRYTDGGVETFVAVPNVNVPFTILLKSEGYIAPGLAAFTFIDGEYQCNRNRGGLKFPSKDVAASEYEIDFRFSQKEEKTSAGKFVGRVWSFAQMDRGMTFLCSQASLLG